MLKNGKTLDHKLIVKLYEEFLARTECVGSLDKFAVELEKERPEWGKVSRQALHYVLKNAEGGKELLAKRREAYSRKEK